MSHVTKKISKSLAIAGFLAIGIEGASAETLRQALAKAYGNNSTLNAARARLRVTNEGIPKARALFLPSLTGKVTYQGTKTFDARRAATAGSTSTFQYGIQLDQRLFNGFRSINTVRQAEAGIRAQRANVQNAELTALLAAVQAYFDVSSDRRIVGLRRQNLSFLEEQVRAANARFEVGEGTRTDVAQAKAQRAAAVAQLNAAKATAAISEASYLQVVGSPAPKSLSSSKVPSHLLPTSLSSARNIAFGRHPAIKAAQYAADGQKFAVKIAEGAFLPTLGLRAAANRTLTNSSSGDNSSASITATLDIPLYAGGVNSSDVRSAKETLSANRLDTDVIRDRTRAQVDRAWAQLQSSRAQTSANRAQVSAGQLALNGVIEERKVGQRTTLDVLLAQQTVINAQIGLAEAEKAERVAGYTLASSTGRLTARALSLGVDYFDDRAHYEQVKVKWYGLRTPDGR